MKEEELHVKKNSLLLIFYIEMASYTHSYCHIGIFTIDNDNG
jgi:hypothetical protein